MILNFLISSISIPSRTINNDPTTEMFSITSGTKTLLSDVDNKNISVFITSPTTPDSATVNPYVAENKNVVIPSNIILNCIMSADPLNPKFNGARIANDPIFCSIINAMAPFMDEPDESGTLFCKYSTRLANFLSKSRPLPIIAPITKEINIKIKLFVLTLPWIPIINIQTATTSIILFISFFGRKDFKSLPKKAATATAITFINM